MREVAVRRVQFHHLEARRQRALGGSDKIADGPPNVFGLIAFGVW